MDRLVIVIRILVLLVIETDTRSPISELEKAGKCGYDSYKVVERAYNNITCVKCKKCPPGFELTVPCGTNIYFMLISNILIKLNICKACSPVTFSGTHSSSPCTSCKQCEYGPLRKCTATQDTICKRCKQGCYYGDEVSSCLPCTRCCGDKNEIKMEECASQGFHNNGKICSIHSKYLCSNYSTTDKPTKTRAELKSPMTNSLGFKKTFQKLLTEKPTQTTQPCGILYPNKRNNVNTDEKDTQNSKERTILVMTSLMIILFILFTIFLIQTFFLRRNLGLEQTQCFPTRLSKNKNISDTCKGDQSDELEDWSNNDVINGIYLFKSGVSIKYDNKSKEDRNKDLVVEVLNDEYVDSNFRNVEPDQIFLSPIFRFYSQGEKFVEKVKVSLPHSALLISDQKNYWDIEILCMDERMGKKAKWEKVDDDVDVNWKDASFVCNTLLTYAVVGKPRQGAKKRMQLVVFAIKDMKSDLFEVALYLLDDNESSFDRVLKENKARGFAMIGSLYATFIDCHTPLDISVSVKGLLDGWELNHLSPKTISNRLCANSYFNIPNFQAVFRRVKRREEKFNCKFTIKVGGNQSDIIIPVFTFVPEEELCVFVDVHEEDRSVLNEKTSLFKDMPYDIQYKVSRMLDVSAKGQGKWRQVGQYFGLTENLEEFSKEYATLDGSPTKALFEYLYASQPNITVGEFAKCLEGLGREDVLSLLYKHRKKI